MLKILNLFFFVFTLFYFGLANSEHEKLALKLLKNFENQDQNSNINFSPFSLEAAFQMVLEGTKGATTQSLLKIFGYESDNTTRLEFTYKMIRSMTNPKNAYSLEIANQIIPDKSLNVKESYINTLRNYYLSQMTPQDFIHQPEQARSYINSWVEDVTHNRIKNLLPAGTIDSDTRLVVVNALYFKAKWLYEFDIEETMNDKFYIDKQNTINTQMMSLNEVVNYAENKNYKIIELPYQGKDISMFVILPQTIQKSLLESFNAFELFRLQKLLKQKRVKVTIPKFKFEWSTSLIDPLMKAGLKYCFSNSADFSNISQAESLQISEIIQKTFIEVNEFGTEAAAATAITTFTESMRIYPETDHIFKADHPFLFYIIHKKFKKILFEGKLYNPNA